LERLDELDEDVRCDINVAPYECTEFESLRQTGNPCLADLYANHGIRLCPESGPGRMRTRTLDERAAQADTAHAGRDRG
jgi:hypothetical protein